MQLAPCGRKLPFCSWVQDNRFRDNDDVHYLSVVHLRSSLPAQRLLLFDDASFGVAHKGQCPNYAPTARNEEEGVVGGLGGCKQAIFLIWAMPM